MSNHITVIDVEYGTSADGFAIRVGPEVSPRLRLANCWYANNSTLVKIANGAYAMNQNFTPYSTFEQAVAAAKNLKVRFPGYKVRVDCTLE